MLGDESRFAYRTSLSYDATRSIDSREMVFGEMRDLNRAMVDVLGRCFDGVGFLSGDKRRRVIRVGGRVQV